MAVKEIIQLGNPKLWQKCTPIDVVSSDETESLVCNLRDTLKAFYHANGYGRAIAAPQIGVLKRVVWVRMRPYGFCGPLINPEIIWQDESRYELWDDCLSFPDLLVKVSRAKAIDVRYLDDNAESQTLRAEGDLSELLQHEIDHLDGILAIQRAVSPQGFTTRREWDRLNQQ